MVSLCFSFRLFFLSFGPQKKRKGPLFRPQKKKRGGKNSPAALSVARVPALGLGLGGGTGPGAGVDLGGLLEDEAVLDELADVLAWREKREREREVFV